MSGSRGWQTLTRTGCAPGCTHWRTWPRSGGGPSRCRAARWCTRHARRRRWSRPARGNDDLPPRRIASTETRSDGDILTFIIQTSYPNGRCQGDEAEDQDSDASCLDHDHASHSKTSVTSSQHIDRSVHCQEGKWRWWQEDAMRHKELVFSHPLCPVSSLTLPPALSHRLVSGGSGVIILCHLKLPNLILL